MLSLLPLLAVLSVNLHDLIVCEPHGTCLEDGAVDYDAIEHAVVYGGADVNKRDSHDMTPLMLSAMIGSDDLAQLLLQLRANPLLQDGMGNTAMHISAMMGHAHVVETVFMNAGPGDGPRSIFMRDKHGRTPLHAAAREGHPAVVEKLLTLGADPAALDDKGATPEADTVKSLKTGEKGFLQQEVLAILRKSATEAQLGMRKQMAEMANAAKPTPRPSSTTPPIQAEAKTPSHWKSKKPRKEEL